MPHVAMRLCLFGLFGLSAPLLLTQPAIAQTKPIASDLNSLNNSVQKASQLLKDGKVVQCVEAVEKATREIQELARSQSPTQMQDLRKAHAELATTHQLLAIQGAELTELPTWETLLKSAKSKRDKKADENKSPSPTTNPTTTNPTTNPDTTTPTPSTETSKTSEPKRKDKVSFSKDIAPLLIANCNGCHYNATRVSGGLQFNVFAQLLKGGDSGPIVLPGKPDDSLLVRKLKGSEGARMPLGRAPLTDSQIQLVSSWIQQGAAFDGQNQNAKLDQVVGQAFAATASHRELMDKRIERTRENWKTAFPKTQPDEAVDEQFHVIGNIGEETAKTLLSQANTVASQIRKLLKLSAKEPFIKGGVTIYALKQRYDYSEFGKMIENRTLPADWSSHWRKEILDSYVAIVVDKAETKINETSLLQQMMSLWVGAHEGVPKWFAEGAGRQALALNVGPNDMRVQPWILRIPSSMDQMKTLKSLTDGTMNDEALATIGFGVIRTMYDSKMKAQYELILRSLASGMSFQNATTKAIGSMDLFLQKLLGKKN